MNSPETNSPQNTTPSANPNLSASLHDLPLHRVIELSQGEELKNLSDATLRDMIQHVAALRGQPQKRRATAKKDAEAGMGKTTGKGLLGDFA